MVRKLAYSVSEREHWISAAGGLLGILAVLWVSHLWLGSHGGVLAVASMGASAVLLFAAPHGALSQPWPVFGGHLVSAAIGVFCARLLKADPVLAASLAVALSIAVMYGLRCLHPPGGATALYAVMGGDAVHALGYGYILSPVLLNVLVILTVAVVFNYPFHWRRYPQSWHRAAVDTAKRADPLRAAEEKAMIPHSDLVYALSQIDTFVDISEEDLQRIYALALQHHRPESAQASAAQLAAESRS
ncbi:MAG: HPP family protein [Thiobacillus sp.]|nr:HPP family protein [Thiobacillus sp.]